MRLAKIMLSLALVALAACNADVNGGTSAEESSENALQTGCTEGVLTSPTCVDPGVFKLDAYNLCKQDNLELVALDFDFGTCGGQTTEAHYECCPIPPPTLPPCGDPNQPPPPKDPPPPYDPPAICSTGTVGDGTCQGYEVFKLDTWDACTQLNLQLFDLTVDEGGCPAGQALSATYSCTAGTSVCPP